MVKSLSVMGITDSDFPMSSIIGRANLLLTTSIGGGVHVGIKNPPERVWFYDIAQSTWIISRSTGFIIDPFISFPETSTGIGISDESGTSMRPFTG
ncbi:hypothetical protein AB4H89_002851 [Salmonella enterica]|uniref:Uncharacterized protein n=2 Tax=Salmonella enterica TaxID=28901 RepID=A0A5T7YF21_SALER|nr:hypothetical protein [Salmonella enterica subsp. diarizonae]EAW6332414.1 hypothetical protein [Salmonella enterica]EBP4000858.1 hypothetical protein [Salmonella enterica subsp. enterica]EBR3875727.1 hypothetical protein [Salmonella enterica subsp. arizonae]EAA5229056.1 hypothetical protein [Salmonella enterica subsp. diarizonae]